MNGPPTTPRFWLFYLASKGRISGSEKTRNIFFSKRALSPFSIGGGGLCPRGRPGSEVPVNESFYTSVN